MPSSPFYKNALFGFIIILLLAALFAILWLLGKYPLLFISVFILTTPLSFLIYKNHDNLLSDFKSTGIYLIIFTLLGISLFGLLAFGTGKGKYVANVNKLFISGHIKKGKVFVEADVVEENGRDRYAPEHYEDTYTFIPANSKDRTLQTIIEKICYYLCFLIPILNYLIVSKTYKYSELIKQENK